MSRPSHLIPREIFEAILELETAARRCAQMDMNADPRAYIQAEVDAGGLRDTLAALILEATR